MERRLATRIIAEGSGDSGHKLHFSFHDQPNGEGYFYSDAGLSFQAVSNVNQNQKPFHVFHGISDYPIGPSILGLPYVTTSDPLVQQMHANPYSVQGDNLKTPKPEMFNEEDRDNFRSQASRRALMLCNSSFPRLPIQPPLNQISGHENQQVPNNFHLRGDFSGVEPLRSLRPSSSSTGSWTVEGLRRNLNLPASFAALQPQKPEVCMVPPSMPPNILARMRRKKISDKTRCLQKLLPSEKKMDIATMLGEAYKYIKFLKAQISVLESMPCESSFTSQTPANVSAFAGLDRLNRQQLLQVLMNSQVVQTMLYSKGCCVVSLEQLLLLKQIAETRVLPQQALFLGH
ncbi:transcription factor bHLH52-like [Macadamia integrifolia]|uniref:transcription factor bHLH52-like n=1 Tax=Macadamia integrifolia TaxID=60698 RepID=UPI001C52FE43|nr:transcription factor bHLH52-like [Macadamia integrifolia]